DLDTLPSWHRPPHPRARHDSSLASRARTRRTSCLSCQTQWQLAHDRSCLILSREILVLHFPRMIQHMPRHAPDDIAHGPFPVFLTDVRTDLPQGGDDCLPVLADGPGVVDGE